MKLEQEIKYELHYSSDVYNTVKIGGNIHYFKVVKKINDGYNREKNIEFFIPEKRMKTKDIFHPISNNGNEIKWLKCSFKRQGSCEIEYNESGKDDSYYLTPKHNWENLPPYTPKILFHKGDKKENTNERLVEALKQETKDLSKKIEILIEETKSKKEKFLKELDTPFVKEEKIAIAIESVEKQMDELTLRHKDTQRLSDLVA